MNKRDITFRLCDLKICVFPKVECTIASLQVSVEPPGSTTAILSSRQKMNDGNGMC